MKKEWILLLFCFLASNIQAQYILESARATVSSPDGKYHFGFYQKELGKDAKQMYYTVSYNGKTVIEESELGVLIDNQLF